MASNQLPALDYLRQCFRYEPDTGKLFWLHRPEWMFVDAVTARKTNTRQAGKEAFTTIHRTGRFVAGLDGKQILAHRVAYYLGTGEHPTLFVDHINGDPLDNRLCNLRLVTRSENARNRSRNPKLWKGSYFGVRQTSKNRWGATIKIAGQKTIRLGNFKTEQEAIAARKAAEKQYNFHDNHGRSSPLGAA